MDWLKEFIGSLAPVVAIVGSVLGILIALDQITVAARLRRRVAFWREMTALKHSSGEDAAVFHSLQREATSRVIALQALPARLLLPSGLLILLPLATLAVPGFAMGQVPENELSWAKVWDTMSGDTGFPFLILLPGAIIVALNRVIDVALLRSQVAADYLDHSELKVSAIELAGMGIRTPSEMLGWATFFRVVAVSLGLSLLPIALAGLAGANARTSGSTPTWAVLVFALGTLLVVFPAPSVVRAARQRITREWHHPRPGQRRASARPPAPLGPRRNVRVIGKLTK